MNQKKIRIGIIDDHELFRKGLKEIIESIPNFTVSMEASNGKELFKYLETTHIEYHPQVFLLDLKMPEIGGIECLKYFQRHFPVHKILILSMFDDDPYIIETMKLGASGYVLKNSTPRELIEGINEVIDKGMYMSSSTSISLLNGLRSKKKNTPLEFGQLKLTDNELVVLSLICQGNTNVEIGKIIHKSVRTVEGYRQRLLDKSNTKNSPSLVAWAFRKGIVE